MSNNIYRLIKSIIYVLHEYLDQLLEKPLKVQVKTECDLSF